MILGDPYKFAIIMKTIEEWNDNEIFCNGILLFCVNGDIFPKEILSATLTSEIEPLKENLGNIAVNDRIFNMKKEEAYEQIYNITFPENWDLGNDYQFDITPLSLADGNYYVFAVSDGIHVRILAAKLQYDTEKSIHILKNASIAEAFLTIQEMKEIANGLKID